MAAIYFCGKRTCSFPVFMNFDTMFEVKFGIKQSGRAVVPFIYSLHKPN